MIHYLLKRPVAVSMFYLGVIILGVISYQNLSVEGQPDTQRPRIVVATQWPNTSPEVIQIFLTSPIEEVAAQLEGLEEMTSSSTRGSSSITLEFNRDTDMEFARLDLNERLANLRANLPSGAFQPNLRLSERDQTNTDQFLAFDISGPYDLQRLSEFFDDYLRDEISSADGVADVQVYGDRKKTLKIKLDRQAMDLYGVVPQTVVNKVNELTRTYEAPRSRLNNQEYTITINNSIPNLAEVEQLVIARSSAQMVRVKDLGRVELGHARVRSLSRLNGNPTLKITIEKEVGASVIQTAKRVRRKVGEALGRLPKDFRLDWGTDQGEMMEEQLWSIYDRGLWCVLLIIILLLFFLQSFSAALIITLNILFSVLITINFMYYFDVTFNVVTLSGLAVGFGMLVDNAIVVLENIFRHRELGRNPIDAAIEGSKEIVWAIFAATLTTVAAFMCMVFLEDRLAVTYMPLALAVIFSLSASLLVSFTFTPLLSTLIRGSNITTERKNWAIRFLKKPLEKFTSTYGTIVKWTLRHKMLVFILTASLLFMFMKIFITEIDSGGFNFFFSQDDRLRVAVRMPEGAELETADEVIRQFEAPLLKAEGYKDVSVRVFNTFALLEVSFEKDMLASAFPMALKSKLIGIAQGFAGVGLSVWGINSDDNYSSGNTGFETYNSSIRILGFNYKDLMDFSNKILRSVKRNRRVKSTKLETSRRSWFSRDQTETVLSVNRNSLREYDIDIDYIMGFLSRNLRLESTSTTKYQGEEMFLEVKFSDADDFDIKSLENLIIRTPSNQRIRLADLVSIQERSVPGGIDRKDQQYMVNIRWDFKSSPRRARNFNEAIFANLEVPPGFKAEMDFSRHLSEDEDKNLKFVIGLAVILVFMIISALYESLIDPLVIFCTIPLSFIGVSWIYWYTGNSFDSTAYIGLIILAGIVVNNSILLVSHINHEIRHMDQSGLDFAGAVAKASQDRLRPILLTAITTIVGLLPLLEEFVSWFLYNPIVGFFLNILNIQVEVSNLENSGLQNTLVMFSSLSRSTVGGMLTATLSTLLVIPVVYAIFFRAKQWLNSRINELFHLSRPTAAKILPTE